MTRMRASAPSSWQAAFVVTTLAMGDPLEAARAGMSEADFAEASASLPGLLGARRDVRARGIAAGLAHIAADIDAARLA